METIKQVPAKKFVYRRHEVIIDNYKSGRNVGFVWTIIGLDGEPLDISDGAYLRIEDSEKNAKQFIDNWIDQD